MDYEPLKARSFHACGTVPKAGGGMRFLTAKKLRKFSAQEQIKKGR
jgi:hypothetical protein